MKKKTIDITVYLWAIFLDSFGIALMIKTNFGATPFGVLISGTALYVPLGMGMISLIYELLFILIASRLRQSRIKWELMIYSGIFAVMLEGQLYLLEGVAMEGLAVKIAVTVLAILIIDLSKALFNVSVYPILSVVELIYAMVERFNMRLDIASKVFSALNIAVGSLFAFIAIGSFHNIGYGTIMAVILLGSFLHHISAPVEKAYKTLTSNQHSDTSYGPKKNTD